MSGNTSTKQELRDELKAKLGAIRASRANDQSIALVNLITNSDHYRSADTILVYASLPAEISLDSLVVRALGDGKRVCVPRMEWDSRTMEMVPIRNLDKDLQIVRYGLRAPRDGLDPVPDDEIALGLIPGLGFNRCGSRLGRGAGFYDRWIESRRAMQRPVTLIGVGFDEQIVPSVPTDEHDQSMDLVMTPTTIYERSHG